MSRSALFAVNKHPAKHTAWPLPGMHLGFFLTFNLETRRWHLRSIQHHVLSDLYKMWHERILLCKHILCKITPQISKNRVGVRNAAGRGGCCLERWIFFFWVCCLCCTDISWNVALQLLSQDSIPLAFHRVLSGRWTVFVLNHWPDVWQLWSICSKIYISIFLFS